MSKHKFVRTDQAYTNSMNWLLNHLESPRSQEDIPQQYSQLLKELVRSGWVIKYYIERVPYYLKKEL